MRQLGSVLQSQLDHIFNPVRNGYLAETLVFAYLRESPVLRAFEGSPIDGAIYRGWREGESLPATAWARIEHARADTSDNCCINFDIKNRRLVERFRRLDGPEGSCWAGNDPTAFQRSQCAFIIVVFNASSGRSRDWIALVPIELYDGLVTKAQVVYNNVLLWSAVDLALHPYVMPMSFLPEAAARVDLASSGSATYINPWSGVELAYWKPRLASSAIATQGPRSSSTQTSASLTHLEWFRKAIEHSPESLKFELNDVQPLLGDFLLLYAPSKSSYLFEHKVNQFTIDGDRIVIHVFIEESKRNPFHPLRLWDFIFFHNHHLNMALCIPRNEVPDNFCTEASGVIDAPIACVQRWMIPLDEQGYWVTDMLRRIILPCARPPEVSLRLLPAALQSGDVLATDALRSRIQGEEEILEDPDFGEEREVENLRSMRAYGLHGLMCLLQDLCAHSGRGLILPLWRHSPCGDYFFINYDWTEQERARYAFSREPPSDAINSTVYAATTIGIPLVAGVFFTDEQGGTLKSPRFSQSRDFGKTSEAYFLHRDSDFILLGDPSPAALSTGTGNMSHPYLMVASEHLQKSPNASQERAQTIRAHLQHCTDPFTFCLPIYDIWKALHTLVAPEAEAVRYVRRAEPIVPSRYKQSLLDIWQSHADAAWVDAEIARQVGPRQRHHLYRSM